MKKLYYCHCLMLIIFVSSFVVAATSEQNYILFPYSEIENILNLKTFSEEVVSVKFKKLKNMINFIENFKKPVPVIKAVCKSVNILCKIKAETCSAIYILKVKSLKKGANLTIKLPGVAVKNFYVEPSSTLRLKSGSVNFQFKTRGLYTIKFEVIKQVKKSEGGKVVSLPTIPSALTHLICKIPQNNIMPEVTDGFIEKVQTDKNITIVFAFLKSSLSEFSIKWAKSVTSQFSHTKYADKKTSNIKAQLLSVYRVDENFLKIKTYVSYKIINTYLTQPVIFIEGDLEILDITGKQIKGFNIINSKSNKRVIITLNKEATDVLSFILRGEIQLNERPSKSYTINFPYIKPLEVKEFEHFIGLTFDPSFSIKILTEKGYTKRDPSTLPSKLISMAYLPISTALVNRGEPANMKLLYSKNPKVEMLTTIISSLNATTIINKNGLSLTKCIYKIQNNKQQYINISLPDSATLLTCFVGNKPIRPGFNSLKNKISIPLLKSNKQNQYFNVEITYCQKHKLKNTSDILFQLPVSDIIANEVNYELNLPEAHSSIDYTGNMNKVSTFYKSDRVTSHDKFLEKRKLIPQYITRKKEQKLSMPQLISQTQIITNKYRLPNESLLNSLKNIIEKEKLSGLLPVKLDLPETNNKLYFKGKFIEAGTPPYIKLKITTFNAKFYLKIFAYLLSLITLLILKKVKRKCYQRLFIVLIIISIVFTYFTQNLYSFYLISGALAGIIFYIIRFLIQPPA